MVRRGASDCMAPCTDSLLMINLSIWLRQGKPERDTAYAPILDALSTIYKDVPEDGRCVTIAHCANDVRGAY